ncbi:M16 family metallopeptidase [Streptomyces sp. JNUCC 64]
MNRNPRSRQPARRFVLGNGLRVLLAPQDGAGPIGLAVHYGVGFRTEPPGRAGLAHLFEHLVFQGGRNVPAGGYARHVQRVGGLCDARTRQDATVYHATAPSFALDTLLALESDRMRGPRLTPETLRAQCAVIKEEVNTAVRDRPYGQFPWVLSRTLNSRRENQRDGYGESAELDGTDLDSCHRFFTDHYAPGNAVLTLTGAFRYEEAVRLVHRHFDDVPSRWHLPPPDLAEPPPVTETVTRVRDRHARAPAVALGMRLPDPVADLPGYLAHLALVPFLVQGAGAPLRRRMAREADVTGLAMGCGLFGQPLDTAGPDLLTLFAVTAPTTGAERVPAALEAELAGIVRLGVDPARLARTTARWSASALRELGDPGTRAQLLGLRETLFGHPGLTDRMPESVRRHVTPERVTQAAGALLSGGRAVVHFTPDPEAG